MNKQEQKQILIDMMEQDEKLGLYKQQTAVEWLVEQIKSDQNQKALSPSEWIQVIEQAKQMEKEQIMESWLDGDNDGSLEPKAFEKIAEEYYKEKYNN